MNDMLSSIDVKSVPPTFKYYHLKGYHSPRTLTKDLENTKKPSLNDSLVALGKIMTRFIEIVKAAGIYQNSQIYIMADHSAYPISSNKSQVEKLDRTLYHKRARPLFLFKDFGATGKLSINHSKISYFDFPDLVVSLSQKPLNVPFEKVVEKFDRKERFFYSFSNMNGKYYPAIHELKVTGSSREPSSWSIIDSYMPSFFGKHSLALGEGIDLGQPDEYLPFLNYGVIGSGNYSRDGEVAFSIPIDNLKPNTDIVLSFSIRPVLSDDGITFREFSLSTPFQKFEKDRADNKIEKLFAYLIPADSIVDGNLVFTINIHNYSRGPSTELETGKVVWNAGLKFGRLEICEEGSFRGKSGSLRRPM